MVIPWSPSSITDHIIFTAFAKNSVYKQLFTYRTPFQKLILTKKSWKWIILSIINIFNSDIFIQS